MEEDCGPFNFLGELPFFALHQIVLSRDWVDTRAGNHSWDDLHLSNEIP
jgi:hypothetical protein